MDERLKPMLEFFRSIGAAEVAHSEKTYLAHAMGVYRDLGNWGCSEDLCLAGLFHSVYGTELFQRFALPLERRTELQALIGAPAERLAYVNCGMVRSSFDQAVFEERNTYEILDRFTDRTVELPAREFEDLCTLHLCDWLEQVPRSKKWEYRRCAYRQMGERLGGIALEAYDRVFALESGKLDS